MDTLVMPSKSMTLGQRTEGFAFTSILAAVTNKDQLETDVLAPLRSPNAS